MGRSEFISGDSIVFTEIRRSATPFEAFTYPGNGYDKDGDGDLDEYDGIVFKATAEGGWTRATDDGGPERIYWTDATSPHTFIAYSIPQDYGQNWKPYRFTQTEGGKTVKKTYYVGAIGDATKTGGANDTIDFTLTTAEQAANTKTVNNTVVYSNPKLEHEDVVLAYDEHLMAEPGGSVALVRFHHALSSIRVVVNISGFSAGTSATADNATVVSNMRLLHQPTMYVWMQADSTAQPLRAYEQGSAVESDQYMVDAAWAGSTAIPSYDQRKHIKLWIPRPAGSGSNQSKTFTFYGITTPQPQGYIGTLAEGDINRKTELEFDVTYPNPMKPAEMQTKTYKATLDGVYYWAGYNTTINISLNHRNEKMTVGAEYENWQFVATPDVGVLKKHSTYLQDTDQSGVTIADDAAATADDATWLYKEEDGTVKDIYDHTGDSEADAYQISTADQLLSFAYEVKSGRDFTGKFVRLDADLSLQQSSDKTKPELLPDADGNIFNTYFNKSLFNYTSISDDVKGISSADMVKAKFVTDLNDGIIEWLNQSGHEDYDPYKYVHQPANYPTIEAVNDKSEIPGSTTP